RIVILDHGAAELPGRQIVNADAVPVRQQDHLLAIWCEGHREPGPHYLSEVVQALPLLRVPDDDGGVVTTADQVFPIARERRISRRPDEVPLSGRVAAYQIQFDLHLPQRLLLAPAPTADDPPRAEPRLFAALQRGRHEGLAVRQLLDCHVAE